MLAFTFEKQGHKIKYPCYVQKKYDGIRLIAIVKDGTCTLWSRTRKPVNSLPHIVSEIEKNFKEDVILDGEAYSHDFKDNFEHIVHLVRQEEPDIRCTDVQYHIYDVVNDEIFDNRILFLTKKFSSAKSPNFKYLRLADTYMVENEDQVPNWFLEFRDQGYEGAMLRNADGLYVNKRSADLIKVKEMLDSEFEIVGIEEGRGKLQGHVGAFICKTESGLEFKAKMSGDTGKLKEYFDNHDLWQNKHLTVQYQGFTAYNVPRFPVGKAIRDYE
jgi:DNA ligase-1